MMESNYGNYRRLLGAKIDFSNRLKYIKLLKYYLKRKVDCSILHDYLSEIYYLKVEDSRFDLLLSGLQSEKLNSLLSYLDSIQERDELILYSDKLLQIIDDCELLATDPKSTISQKLFESIDERQTVEQTFQTRVKQFIDDYDIS